MLMKIYISLTKLSYPGLKISAKDNVEQVSEDDTKAFLNIEYVYLLPLSSYF